MAFVSKEWKTRKVEYPGRRVLKNPTTGVSTTYDVSRAEGEILQEGDAFSSANMNDLEQRVSNEFGKINKNLPTYEIQFGIVEAFECAGKTVTTFDVTFPFAFAEVPVIVLTIASGSSYSDYGALTAFVDYDTRSTTGFKIRVANHNSSGLSPAINWMAIGKKLS